MSATIDVLHPEKPKHAALIERTPALKDVNPVDYDAIMAIGGQGPMYTFINDEDLHRFIANFYATGKVTCAICHGTCVLLKVKLSNGKLLVEEKTWSGFANSEEDYADAFVPTGCAMRYYPFLSLRGWLVLKA